MLAMVLAITLAAVPVLAADYYSPSKVTTEGDNTLAWTGQGASNGTLKAFQCDEDNTPYLLWLFTADGGKAEYKPGETPYVVLGGTGNGTYYPSFANPAQNTFHFVTPYFEPTSNLTAVVHFNTIDTGGGAYILTISHGCPGGPRPPQAELSIVKFYDADADGAWDLGEPELLDWYVAIDGEPYLTPFSGNVSAGTYNITESVPIEPSWVASGITVEGTEDYSIVSNTEVHVTLAADDDVTVYFGNYCLVPSGGKTLGFWSNKNGKALFGDDDLAAMVTLNLRSANGTHFDPANYAAFKTWLLSAKATNMAYMLSAQLAAMRLNVLNGFVDGNAFYIPYAGTINELIAEADAALAADGYTPAGDPNRSAQETLKNYLDALNNGASVVNPEPCTYTFP